MYVFSGLYTKLTVFLIVKLFSKLVSWITSWKTVNTKLLPFSLGVGKWGWVAKKQWIVMADDDTISYSV